MAEFFDPFSEPRYTRNRRNTSQSGRNRSVNQFRAARGPDQDLVAKIEALQQQVDEQARTIEAQKKQLQIKSDAIGQQTKDIKSLDAELMWTRAALEQAQKEVEQVGTQSEGSWQERFLRLQADVENLRKRLEQRSEEKVKEKRNQILADMLPLADHLELALRHAGTESEETETNGINQSFVQNIRATFDAFMSTLKRYDVVPIDAYAKPFDPTKHEAVGRVDSNDVPADAVAQVLQTGYMEGDRLLRPARVMVSNG